MTATLEMPPILHLHERRDVWLPSVTGFVAQLPEAPMCKDPARREAGGKSLRAFKRIYFPPWVQEVLGIRWIDDSDGKFHNEFLDALDIAIRALAVLYEAWAVSRGLGKTTDAEIATVYCVLYKLRELILWISLNGPESEKRVGAIKTIFEVNPLLLEDFPELVAPIKNFNGDPRGAHSEKMVWTNSDLKFPNGVRVAGRGIDGQIRGFNIDLKRPDLVFPDDIENEFTVRSEAETNMRRAKMEKEVSALHGQGAGIVRCSYFLIGTIPAQGCLTDEYTDQAKRPDWNGQRRGAMLKPPARLELWEKFMELSRARKDEETDAARLHFAEVALTVAPLVGLSVEAFSSYGFGMRQALEFYAPQKAEMDEGVLMLEPIQLPAWLYYWTLANKGESYVASELQCAPIAPEGTEEKVLHGEYILSRRGRTPAFVIPHWAKYPCVKVDVQKHCLWVEVEAWNAELDTTQMIEFGKVDTGMNRDGAFDALQSVDDKRRRVDQIIFDTLMRVHKRVSQGWPQAGTGEMIFPAICGVDCGGTTPLEKDEAHAWYDAVLSFCQPHNSGGKWIPLKGEKWSKSIQERALANGNAHWILEEKSQQHGRRDCHTDYYKTQHYDALQITADLDTSGIPVRGAKILHAEGGFRLADDGVTKIYSDAKIYAKHCSAEKFVAEFKEGNVEQNDRVGWQLVSKGRRDNHGWDTGWMGFALRDMLKFKLRQRRPMPVFGGQKRSGSNPYAS